jgi:hypothetical protein
VILTISYTGNKGIATTKYPATLTPSNVKDPGEGARQKSYHKTMIQRHLGLQLPTKQIAKQTTIKPKIASKTKLSHLRAFYKKYLGISDYDEKTAALGETYYKHICKDNGVCGGEHSFDQEVYLEIMLLVPLLNSGFLSPPDMVTILEAQPAKWPTLPTISAGFVSTT